MIREDSHPLVADAMSFHKDVDCIKGECVKLRHKASCLHNALRQGRERDFNYPEREDFKKVRRVIEESLTDTERFLADAQALLELSIDDIRNAQF